VVGRVERVASAASTNEDVGSATDGH